MIKTHRLKYVVIFIQICNYIIHKNRIFPDFENKVKHLNNIIIMMMIMMTTVIIIIISPGDQKILG